MEEQENETSNNEEKVEWNKVPSQQLEYLQSQIDRNKWDPVPRDKLIKESLVTNDLTLIRKAYSDYLDRFPTHTHVWIDWIVFERDQQNFDELEQIFKKSIPINCKVDLYFHYLDYIRHVHSLPEGRETVTKAFEFITQVVGTSIDSGDLWLEYIKFTKEQVCQSNYEEQQKMDSLRKIFHKAIITPITNIEDIWKEYDNFENELSKLTAKKFIADRAAGYMTARGAMKDLKSLLEPIERIEQKWTVKPPEYTQQEVLVLNLWKRYIAWESSNPLHFDDKNLLKGRVMYAYKSCLLMMKFYPEIWYDGAEFLSSLELKDEAISFLKQGLEFNPTSLVLNFSLIEKLESKKLLNELKEVFQTLIDNLEDGIAEINANFDNERDILLSFLQESNLRDTTDEDEGEKRERERLQKKENDNEVEIRVESKRKLKIREQIEKITLAWIMFMRITRRSDQDPINNARRVFSKARKTSLKKKTVNSYLFIASAFMEFYTNKEPGVAGKVFEAGLKEFPLGTDPDAAEYVLHYIDYFMCLNDDNNTRALFERALSTIPSDRTKVLWEKYVEYEMLYGDLGNLRRVEHRFNEAYPSENSNTVKYVEHIADKWNYFEIKVISSELGLDSLKKVTRLPPPAAQSKFGTAGGSDRRDDRGKQSAMLKGVDVEKFPRPETGMWSQYKAEPGQAKSAQIVSVGDTPNGNHARKLSGDRNMMIPEPVARFLSALPRAELYDGPIINTAELLGMLTAVPLPLPLGVPIMVPLAAKEVGRKRPRRDDGDPRTQKYRRE